MAPFDDWNKLDEEEEEELQDNSYFEGARDVILFCIDCSESMLELRDDPNYEDSKTSHLLAALEAAMQIQKRKVIVGPNDSVGILMFNTTRKPETKDQGSELKRNHFIFQPVAQVNAPKIQDLIQVLESARDDPKELREAFPCLPDKKVPIGDVFTSCNWVFRDSAPKTSTKRIFLITDDDDPHSGSTNPQLITSAKTTLSDLTGAGVIVEPFFISSEDKPFDQKKFYSSILHRNIEKDEDEDSHVLPDSISITRIDDLLDQMRVHEQPKRSLFSIPFELAKDFVIGVKGYGLVTEQKRGSYKYFVDLGDRMEVVGVRTVYVDEDRQTEVDKSKFLYGMSLREVPAAKDKDESDDEADIGLAATRTVEAGSRPFYTADEVKSFRTLGLEPGLKLLGFKPRKELAFEDNIKHSTFIYPDEMAYSGSKRTFSALLKSMLKKKKIALVLGLTRRNSSPYFYALLPQAEKTDEGGWNEPSGFHMIPLPFADDIRGAPIEQAYRASDDLKDLARAWIDKLAIKNGTYNPDSYPNPALAYHNEQLQAVAFREEYDPEAFEDLTLPKIDMIHKRAGKLIQEWKEALDDDEGAKLVVIETKTTGTKRKADVSVDEAEIRSKYEDGSLAKLRVDQLKDFLKSKSEPVSGKKGDLVERAAKWLRDHS